VRSLISQHHLNVFSFCHSLFWFFQDYRFYKRQASNQSFVLSAHYLYPCLTDKTVYTPVEYTYFFQDAWCAEKIFQTNPQHHYDVGSSVKTMGLVSQFVPTTMVDIRPIDLELKNFFFKEGSVLELPFKDGSLVSLSSLCVIEHIGLGRYGDLIDPWGSEKAANELMRVLAAGGNLFVSVPVDQTCRIYFNAHRAFTRDYALQIFKGMDLIEEKYIYGNQLHDVYEETKGFGTGLFHFKKPSL
jgi:SAM-dependent methyltransferase